MNERTIEIKNAAAVPMVTISKSEYERLVRDSERLTTLSTAIWNALKHGANYTSRIGIESDQLLPVFKAVCPDDWDAWVSQNPASESEDE